MAEDPVLERLISERDRLKKKIQEMTEILDHLNGAISFISDGVPDTPTHEFEQLAPHQELGNSSQARKIGPVEAVRRIFEANPDKRLRPATLRDELLALKNSGRLHTTSEDMQNTVYWAVHTLVRQRFVIKGGDRRKPWYKKASASS